MCPPGKGRQWSHGGGGAKVRVPGRETQSRRGSVCQPSTSVGPGAPGPRTAGGCGAWDTRLRRGQGVVGGCDPTVSCHFPRGSRHHRAPTESSESSILKKKQLTYRKCKQRTRPRLTQFLNPNITTLGPLWQTSFSKSPLFSYFQRVLHYIFLNVLRP